MKLIGQRHVFLTSPNKDVQWRRNSFCLGGGLGPNAQELIGNSGIIAFFSKQNVIFFVYAATAVLHEIAIKIYNISFSFY